MNLPTAQQQFHKLISLTEKRRKAEDRLRACTNREQGRGLKDGIAKLKFDIESLEEKLENQLGEKLFGDLLESIYEADPNNPRTFKVIWEETFPPAPKAEKRPPGRPTEDGSNRQWLRARTEGKDKIPAEYLLAEALDRGMPSGTLAHYMGELGFFQPKIWVRKVE